MRGAQFVSIGIPTISCNLRGRRGRDRMLVGFTTTYGDPVIKKGGLGPLNGFNPSTFCACLKPGPGFPTSYIVFVFSEFS
jgi:hypothetical protein